MHKFSTFIHGFVHKYKVFLLVLSDLLSITLSLSLSIYILYSGNPSLIIDFLSRFWWLIPLTFAFRIGIFRNYGLYHWAWQYISMHEVLSLIKAVLLSSMLIAMSMLVFGATSFPFSILVIDALFCFAFIGGVRFSIRFWKESKSSVSLAGRAKKVLIVGAGDAGEMILREMIKKPARSTYDPIGFIDDNRLKIGTFIHNLPVLGNCESIPEMVLAHGIEKIIIAIPSANREEIRRIVGFCEQSNVDFKIVPGLFDLLDRTVHVNQIRDVEIEDLLGRAPVKLNLNEISSYLSNANILITGAGGSIGAELCRQIATFNPAQLILVGKGENSIFDIELELKNKFPYLSLALVIADIRNHDRMKNIFQAYKPAVVFHAAAHKHVSLMERNPDEAVLNNVLGTKNIVDLADSFQVRNFVMISTDKAVNPSSIMGATKRIAEMIVQSKATISKNTKFVSVRFGNVLGSRGSVVPLFKKQIAAGGPVTVTHPDARRYFMTIPEAVQLVIQAGAMGNGGEIFILNMGEPVKIVDLANDLIRLSGLEAGKDIKIKFIGLKPGEKLFEEILTAEEGAQTTKHEKIFIAPPSRIAVGKLGEDIEGLASLASAGDCAGVKMKIREIVPTFKEVII